MKKRYTNFSLYKILIFILLALPAIGFSRVAGGPDDPTTPDSLANKEGHLSCLLVADTNCITREITLEAWIKYSFTGISEPVTVPWSTGVTAHKIIVTPPGWWEWDVSVFTCEHYHNSNVINIESSFFNGPLDIVGSPFLCEGETSELTVNTNGYDEFSSYQWSPSSNSFSPNIIDQPGNYSLTVTDAFNCPFTDHINITPVPDFSPQIAGPNRICPEGDTAVLTVLGPYSNFIWGSNNMGNPITVTEPGNYDVTVTDIHGCTGMNSYALLSGGVDPFPITMTTPSICPGQVDTLRVNGAFTHYDWSNNVTGITNIVNQAGTYTVTVTNSYGCTGTGTTTVAALLPPNIQITNTPLCPGGTATLTTTGGNFPAYHWSTNQNTAAITVGATGTYTVTVSGAGLCATSTNVVVNLAAVPTTVIADPGLLTCSITQDTLNGNTSSSGANFPLTWTTNGGNFVSGQNTLTPLVNMPGIYILSITNTTTGCITNDTVLVTQNIAPPGANAGPPATITCANQSLIIGPVPPPNNPNLHPVWTTGNGNISSGGNTWAPTVTLLGNYTLTVIDSSNSCTSTANVAIAQDIVPPVAQIAPPTLLTCTQSTVPLNGGGSSSGPNFSYQWSTANGTLNGATTAINATAASIGTYTLTVTNTSNGCTSTSSVTVTADMNIPVVNAQAPNILTCSLQNVTINASGSSNGPTYQYTWTTSTGTIVSGGNTLTPVVSGPGTYTLSLFNTANNCAATLGVQVQQDIQPPIADAGLATTLSCSVSSLQLDGSASDTGPNFTYQWSTTNGVIVSGNTMLTPTISLAGTYVLQVTNTTNGCTSTASIQVLNDASAPVALITPPAILTCTTTQITINASASTQTGNVTYVWSGPGIVSGQGTLQPGVDVPGTYILQITNNVNGCTDDATVVVNQDIVPPVASAGSDVLINCYNPTGSIGSGSNPSGAGFVLTWTTVDGNFTASTTGPTAAINQAGSYQLLITNTQNGCTDTDDVLVQADFAPPAVDAGPTTELSCVVTSTVLQGTGSVGGIFTYLWSTNGGNILSGGNTLTPTVNADGYYNLLITNTQNGCISNDQVTITQSADVPVALAGQPQTLTCTLTNTTLNGVGSSAGPEFSYAWSANNGGNITSGANTLTPGIDAPGTYIVTVTNSTNSCTAVANVVITENIQLPVVNAGLDNTLTCVVTTLPLHAQIVSSSSTGISYVWGTIGGQIISGGNSATPNIGASGQYTVTVTDALNGCTSTDQLQIASDVTLPNALIGNPQTLTCAITQISLNTTGSSTGLNFNYVWNTVGGNIVSLQNPQQPVVDNPGVYNVLITNTVNGCTKTASVTVPEDVQPPTAEAGQTVGLDCDTQTNALNGNGSSAGAIYTYAWSTQDGQIVSGNSTLTPTISDPGTYILTVTNTQNGCVQTDNVLVTENVVPPAFNIATPQVLTCSILSVPLNSTGSNLGTPTYTWTTTNGQIVSGSSTPNATVNKPGTYTLTVLNTVNGCSTTAPVAVTQNITPPNLTVQPAQMLTCTVLQFPLQSTAAAQTSISWSTANGHIVSGANTFNPLVDQSGIYQAVVTSNVNGCTSTDQIPVQQETNLPTGVQFNLTHPLCNGTPGLLHINQVAGGVGPYAYSIDGGQNFFTFQEFGDLEPGHFDLVVQDVNGCEITQPITVIQPLLPLVTLPPHFDIELGENQVLHAIVPPPFPLSLVEQVIWDPTEGLTFKSNSIIDLLNPTANPFKTTEYKVTIITKGGCNAEARSTLKVDGNVDIYVPNVIWPDDHDGNNSTFQIFARDESVADIRKLQIFDRWGTLLFENKNFKPNDLSNGWDGEYRGRIVDPAVFVWWAEVQLIDGRVLLLKGDVTVVR